MSAKEVTALRKNGQLQEAYEMADKDLEADPENIFNKRSMAWVLYEYLKESAREENHDDFIAYLESLRKLELPSDEKMVFDNCAFQIAKVVFALNRQSSPEFEKIDRIFDVIRTFPFTRPSDGWTILLKAFHKGNHSWPRYLEFVDWWGLDYLQPGDYRSEEVNGRQIMAVAEQVYIAYARKLLEQLSKPDSVITRDSEKVHSFMQRLEQLIGKHPEYRYPSYYMARLLLATGNNENVLETFLPFARKKQMDFWVWDLLAEIFQDDPEKQFACYCKALTLDTPGEFLVNLRQKFVPLLLARKLYGEARWEVDQIVKDRSARQWKIPSKVLDWKQEPWYSEVVVPDDPGALYRQYQHDAEQLLYQDLPEETVVVTKINKEKTILNFMKDTRHTGFFNYAAFLSDPAMYDILKVRFEKVESSGYARVYTARKDNSATTPVLQSFEGDLKVLADYQIGFVDNVLVSKELLSSFSLEDGMYVTGRAVRSFNKKKNEWGWKAIDIFRD